MVHFLYASIIISMHSIQVRDSLTCSPAQHTRHISHGMAFLNQTILLDIIYSMIKDYF